MNSERAYRHEVMDAQNLADLYPLPPMDWTAITVEPGGATQWRI
jgi:hypothetical protein